MILLGEIFHAKNSFLTDKSRWPSQTVLEEIKGNRNWEHVLSADGPDVFGKNFYAKSICGI